MNNLNSFLDIRKMVTGNRAIYVESSSGMITIVVLTLSTIGQMD